MASILISKSGPKWTDRFSKLGMLCPSPSQVCPAFIVDFCGTGDVLPVNVGGASTAIIAVCFGATISIIIVVAVSCYIYKRTVVGPQRLQVSYSHV